MKLDPRFRVQKAASKDRSRPYLATTWLDVDAKRLFATTGWALASVPVEVGPSDRSGEVPVEAVKALLTGVPAIARKSLVVVNGSTMYRRKVEGSPLANPKTRESIIPTFRKGDKGTVTIGFSATMLKELAAAIGCTDADRGVELTIKVEAGEATLDPFIVTSGNYDLDSLGVLMPRRLR